MIGHEFDAWTRRQFAAIATGGLAWLIALAGGDDAGAGDNKKKRRRKQKRRRRRRRRQDQQASPPPPPASPPPGGATRPDIILINVDDMRQPDFIALPRTMALLASEGMTFPNYLLTTPLCGPSRSSLLRGQYAHNHGVLRNGGSQGGWRTFHDLGRDQSTIATWLRAASPAYRTAMIGKYLNGARFRQGEIAPGWSDWYVPTPVAFYNYTLNANGISEEHGNAEADYLTDVLADRASDFITSTPAGTPLFLYFTPKAPHGPATPANRHIGAFASHALDQSGSFNEADVSDKPAYIQNQPLFNANQIENIEQNDRDRLESLLAVDDAVAAIVDALTRAGRLSNAYIFFVTDNGFLLGQHRRTGKQVPYEESIRMAMLVRGPGVSRGGTHNALVANVDLGPTIAELAGVTPPNFVDGRSLADTLTGGSNGRQAMLIEGFSGQESDPEEMEAARALPSQEGLPQYRAIRTANRTYVEYRNNAEDRELYDLTIDAQQLVSRHDDPAYDAEMQQLSAWLAALEECQGDSCRTLENGPPVG